MSAVIDFQNDLKETTLQLLNLHGVRYKKKDDLPHLLIKLYTFLNKYIAPQVRRVSYSKELISKVSTLPEATQQALSKMEQWVSIGVDVNAFQSRGLYGEGSRDYQNAFYEMVHLHLSAKKDDVTPVLVKGRFAKPSDYLLFAIFKQGEAFFVDVVQHPQALSKKNPRVITWTTSDLLKILEKNWPSLVEPMRIPGLSGSNSKGEGIKLTDEDVAELTVNGVSTFIEGNHGIYMPKMGIASSGDNTMAVISAQKEIRNAFISQEHFTKHEDEIRTIFVTQLSAANIAIPQEFDFHYDYIPELKNHFIVDRNTGAAFDVFSGDLYTPI